MKNLLSLPIFKLYFTALPSDTMANGNLIIDGMTYPISEGDRVLMYGVEGWKEIRAPEGIAVDWHPDAVRLPIKFQSREARVTCPDCHLTYTHEHIFSVPVKS